MIIIFIDIIIKVININIFLVIVFFEIILYISMDIALIINEQINVINNNTKK